MTIPRTALTRIGLAVALVVVLVGCAVDRTSPGATPATTPAPRLVPVDEFAQRIARPDVVTINVHVPAEGSIAGTDLTIPFDHIATSTQLPSDLHTPLAVYCRSGNMSATAVKVLHEKGYTDVVELAGGFRAWTDSGRPLDQP